MRRAEIDIAYTTGFSPHQIMSFAAPLGVGLESNGEYVDIEVNSVTTSKAMTDSLNAVSVNGIEITDIRLLPDNAGNAMATVAAADYTVRFRENMVPDFDYISQLREFYKSESIMVTKKTKKNEMELDLKPAIYQLKGNADGSIYMLVNASSSGNIKPAMVMEAFCKANQYELPENALLITREDTYLNQGTIEEPSFISMNCLGEIF